MRLRTIGFLVMVSALAVVAACGGDDDGGTPAPGASELDSYFTEVDAIFGEAVAALAHGDSGTDPLVVEGTDDEKIVRETIAAEKYAVSVLETALLAMTEVDAPQEARDAHDAWLQAMTGMVQLFADRATAIEEMTTTAEIDTYFAEHGPATKDAHDASLAACNDLQDLADENSVDVDLNCSDL